MKGKDYRTVAFRPKVQKHVREDDRLLYTDSETHERFVDVTLLPGSKPREPFKPPMDKPTNASAGFRFNASTRYSEEYVDVSGMAFRPPEQIRGSTNSSRVYGSALPAKVISFKTANGVRDLLESSVPPVRDILFGSSEISHRGSSDDAIFADPSNPYISEFMSAPQ